MWPLLDLLFSKLPIALIATPDGGLELYPISKTVGRYFWIEKYGLFMIEPKKFKPIKNGGGRTRLALYDARSGKPLDWEVLKALRDFAKTNGLLRITNKSIEAGKLGAIGQTTKEEMIDNIKNQRSVTMHVALDGDAELFLNEFKNFKPFELGAYLQRALLLVKNYKQLKTTPMKPTFQIGAILGGLIIIIVIIMAIPSVLNAFGGPNGGGDLASHLGGIFKMFPTSTPPSTP